MDNPETLATLGKQYTRLRQNKTKNTTQTIKKMSYTDTNKTGGDPRCLRREAVPASYKTSTGDDPMCLRREAVPASYKTSTRDDPRCLRREAVPASYKISVMLSAENQSNCPLKRNYYIRILNDLKMCFCFNFLIPNIPLTTS
jgi:hypothetical protein